MKSGLDHTMAEDCTQDVMATLWHKAHLYDPARATPAAWIFTIARNRKIDLLRKSTRQDPDILPWGPEAAPDQADVIAQREMAHVLTQAIGDLPRTQQDMIKQAYFGDLSHQEISDKTGLPLGTIKSRIRLAMERLRHTMKTTRGD